jgi:hypothetical protein
MSRSANVLPLALRGAITARSPTTAPHTWATAKLDEISLRCEGENNPTVDVSTPGETTGRVVFEKMYEIRFAGDEELMKLMAWMKT